jgi:hypothetical protein
MTLAPSVVEPWVAARHAMIAQQDPHSARRFAAALTESPSQLSYVTLDLFAWWMAHQAPLATPFVWAQGETHHAHVCTLANGKRNRFGACPIYLGWQGDDDRHRAPWSWDIVRLLSSVRLSCPTLKPATWTALTQALFADYVRILTAIADHDEHAERFDFHGLPEAAKQLWELDSSDKQYQTWWKQWVRGKKLLRSTTLRSDDAMHTWLQQNFSKGQVLDCVRCDHATTKRTHNQHLSDITNMGQAHWLVLLSEIPHADAAPLRLARLHTRRASRLAPLLPELTPTLLPSAQTQRDPYAHDLMASGRMLRLSSWDHTRKTIPLTALDQGDFIRLARYWGQLIACAHGDARPITAVNKHILNNIISQIPGHQNALIAQSEELAAWYRKLHRHVLSMFSSHKLG